VNPDSGSAADSLLLVLKRVWMRLVTTLVLSTASAQAFADWQFQQVHDDFDNSTAQILQVESSMPVKGTDGQQHYPFLQLRCDEDGGQPYWRIHWFAIVDVSVSVNSIVGVVSDTRMRVRIDGKEDKRLIWEWPPDESLEGIQTYRVPAIVNALKGAHELKIRIAGKFGETYDATFDVSNLGPALEQMRPHCKRL